KNTAFTVWIVLSALLKLVASDVGGGFAETLEAIKAETHDLPILPPYTTNVSSRGEAPVLPPELKALDFCESSSEVSVGR
ncbi:MAG TPA: hypothetical protein VJN69_07500, partial [Candidatus Acidoferrales bacterium]|nr:hypothetical protein [Candidatus Acidoferrales bacterium]